MLPGLVDTFHRLVVKLESAQGSSGCRHCAFKCRRVWDQRRGGFVILS